VRNSYVVFGDRAEIYLTRRNGEIMRTLVDLDGLARRLGLLYTYKQGGPFDLP
jgi:hypothetical protein